MRRQHHVRVRAQRVVGGQRLLLEDVQRGAGDLAGVERGDQGFVVEQATARAVDDAHAGLAARQRINAEDVVRAVGQRRVQRQEVRLRQDLVDLEQFDAERLGDLGRQEGVEAEDAHAEGLGADRDVAPDASQPDDPAGLAVQLDAHQPFLVPLAGAHPRIGCGDVAAQRQQHRQRVLGRRQRVLARRVHDQHAARGGGGHVDVVDARSGAPDDPQLRCRGDHLGGDGGRRAHHQSFGLGQRGELLVVRQAGPVVDVEAGFGEDAAAVRRDLVGEEDPHRVVPAAVARQVSKRASRSSIAATSCSPMWPMRKVLPFRSP